MKKKSKEGEMLEKKKEGAWKAQRQVQRQLQEETARQKLHYC